MSRRRKQIAIVAGAAAAFAVAGGGAAIGADVLSPEDQNKAVIDDAAKQLGVEPSELSNALKDALKNRIDEAVKAGRLTEEQGNALKKRIDSSDAPFLFGGFGGRGFGLGGPGDRGFGRGFGGPHIWGLHDLSAAASYLGIDRSRAARRARRRKEPCRGREGKGQVGERAGPGARRRRPEAACRRGCRRTADPDAGGRDREGPRSPDHGARQSRAGYLAKLSWRAPPWPAPGHDFGRPDHMGRPA